jgi:glucosylceramidase
MQALADYFVRTINEYHRFGLEVHYVGIQNEPGISIDYPSMLMSDEQQQEFIRILGERLRREGFRAQIIANDDNYIAVSRVKGFLASPAVAKNVGVAGFHCWSNDHERAQELMSKVTMFETECGANINSSDYYNDFFWWLNLRVIRNSQFGLSGVIAWNMVSDEHAGPHGAGPQGCRTCRGLVVVRPVDGVREGQSPKFQLEFNSEFRALSHASRFVKRGAKRVASVLSEKGVGSELLNQVATSLLKKRSLESHSMVKRRVLLNWRRAKRLQSWGRQLASGIIGLY